MPIGTSDGQYHEDSVSFQRMLFESAPLGPEQTFSKTPNDRVREGHIDVEGAKQKIWEQGSETRYQNNSGDILEGYIT